MHKLYFLTPDPDTTIRIAHELGDMGLPRNQLHVTARNQDQLDELGLKEATLIQTSDAINAARRGLLIGIPLGLVIGLIAAAVLSLPSQAADLALVAGLGIFGGLFGLWASTMIGVSVPDVKIKTFQPELKRGAFLMMVDLPEHQEEEKVTEIIRRHHPEVRIEKMTGEEKHHAEGQGH